MRRRRTSGPPGRGRQLGGPARLSAPTPRCGAGANRGQPVGQEAAHQPRVGPPVPVCLPGQRPQPVPPTPRGSRTRDRPHRPPPRRSRRAPPAHPPRSRCHRHCRARGNPRARTASPGDQPPQHRRRQQPQPPNARGHRALATQPTSPAAATSHRSPSRTSGRSNSQSSGRACARATVHPFAVPATRAFPPPRNENPPADPGTTRTALSPPTTATSPSCTTRSPLRPNHPTTAHRHGFPTPDK
ncbi:hypothetical protein SAMN05216174_10171 [Actinokineospora iranica]|uniref:Uncharacterized protein n=1 Tax=Actinokineospora iranica TaxID=1271860 RepID=A0A1G6ITL4_9PSEU|nr:hypothetical protein SAMN05216174_10171 [Actinokineospora iranica]